MAVRSISAGIRCVSVKYSFFNAEVGSHLHITSQVASCFYIPIDMNIFFNCEMKITLEGKKEACTAVVSIKLSYFQVARTDFRFSSQSTQKNVREKNLIFCKVIGVGGEGVVS